MHAEIARRSLSPVGVTPPLGTKVRAGCRVKVALRHIYVVLRMRRLAHARRLCDTQVGGIVCTVTRSCSWCNG